MKAEAVFLFWNHTLGLIHHKSLSHDIEIAIEGALKHYTVSEIQDAIFNYGMVVSNKNYTWTYRWTLGTFLTVKRGKCKDDPKQWWRFLENNFVREDYLKREGGVKKTKLFPIQGKNCSVKGCKLPAVQKRKTEGAYDYYDCALHLPDEVKELYE